MTKTLRADATPMLRGAVFQLCVAVESCFKLKARQVLYVEELGDVTVAADTQTEVKLHSSPLTDNHPNFWNTLFNWTDSAMDARQFRFLILLTSQEFGTECQLVRFNELEPAKRLQLLVSIHEGLARDFERRTRKAGGSPSKTLVQQRELLMGDRRALLEELIGRIFIEARCATPSELYTRLCQEQARHVLDSKRESYVDAVFGFVCRGGLTEQSHWKITCEEFNEQIQALTSTYCQESRQFPRAEFDRIDLADIDESSQDIFVQKLKEIGATGSHVKKAIRDYEGTTSTIDKEFRNHTSAGLHLKRFTTDVIDLFESGHELACFAPAHDVNSSMRFYLEMIGSTPPTFPGYADSPANFRNGILHVTMDDHNSNYVWKVIKK